MMLMVSSLYAVCTILRYEAVHLDVAAGIEGN